MDIQLPNNDYGIRNKSAIALFGARAGNRTRVEASTTPHDNRYTTRAASRRVTTAI